MPKQKKETNKAASKSLKMADEFKEFCRKLIKDKVTNRAEKERLAEELDMTPGGVEGLIYHGRGSFETYVAAIAFLYELGIDDLEGFLEFFRQNIERSRSLEESDRVWFGLDHSLSKETKSAIAKLLQSISKNFVIEIREK